MLRLGKLSNREPAIVQRVSPGENSHWVERLPEHSVVIDEDGQIRFASASFLEFSRLSEEQMTGRTLPSVAYEGDREKLWDAIERATEDDTADTTFGFRIQGHNGTWHVLEGKARRLPDQVPGEGLLVTLRDITERQRRERELEKQNERLDEFAKIVSHDLRSPLQVAKLHLDSIKDSEESLEKVRESHERMDAIITDVLMLARQGVAVEEYESVSLEMVAQKAWGTVDTKEMELVVRNNATVEADPDRLHRLLENLFRNTAEHAGPAATVTVGPLDLMVTSTRAERPNGFFVADDGPGIPEDDYETVFEFGYSTVHDGTGFGLSIVKEIAEAHQWRAEVTESLDGGARFTFTEVPEQDRLVPGND